MPRRSCADEVQLCGSVGERTKAHSVRAPAAEQSAGELTIGDIDKDGLAVTAAEIGASHHAAIDVTDPLSFETFLAEM
ncbi:hypothetical protein AB0M45_21150 [Nocardia sp. NPDC051787]|uniref:hypothetical protein n=1 Tax=Nocardia sp. NPDC051787 TaxID=3155415 RepID=UPI0034485FE8